MPRYKLGVILEQGVCEYLFETDGSTFFDACQRYAASNPEFARHFDARAMTFKRRRLVSLDAYFKMKEYGYPKLH